MKYVFRLFGFYFLTIRCSVSFNSAPPTLFSLIYIFFFFLYQSLVHWSRVASSFCCRRLNRLVLDDRSKILTTSGEKHDAQPGRERRRPDRSTGLHRGDAPLDKGRAMPHSAGRPGKDFFSLCLILMSAFVCRYVGCTVWDKTVRRLPANMAGFLFYFIF